MELKPVSQQNLPIPGCQLDTAVAKALGLDVTSAGTWIPEGFPVTGGVILTIGKVDRTDRLYKGQPPFSTDWNAAMWAAEKAGLFHTAGPRLCRISDVWQVEHDDGRTIAQSATGPHAISLAVLKVKGHQP